MIWLSRAVALTALLLVAFAGCRAAASSSEGEPSTDGVAGETAQTAADTGVTALLERGRNAYFDAEYSSAQDLLGKALVSAREHGDSAAHADALTWLGLTAWRLGENAEARRLGEAALGMKSRLGLSSELFRSYNALGLLADGEGRYQEAIELFRRAGDAARTVGDSAGVAKAAGNSGMSYLELGEFERARAAFHLLLNSARSAGDTLTQANALTNVASAAVRLGEIADAMRVLEEARRLYAAAEYPVGEENVLAQLGTAYANLGDPHRAVTYLDSALQITRRHGLKHQESENLQLAADVFGELGDHRRALEYLARARALSEQLGQISELGTIAAAEAQQHLLLGSFGVAAERAVEAMRLHRVSGARLELVRDDILFAEIMQRAGRAGEAAAALNAAGELARQIDAPIADAWLAIARARIADLRLDPVEVLRALSIGTVSLSRLGPAMEWEAHALRARAHARQGRYQDAVASGRLAVRSIEQVRDRVAAGALRVSFTDLRSNVYSDLVLALLELGQTEEALEVADAARGRALLQHIRAGRSAVTGGARELAEAEKLLARIDWLVERLQQAEAEPRRERASVEFAATAALAERLMETRRSYEALLERVSIADPAAAAMLGVRVWDRRDRARPHAQSVQQALAPGETMLEYFVAGDALVTFVVTGGGVRSVRTRADGEELAGAVRFARDALKHSGRDANNGDGAMRRLYDLLITPAETPGLLRGARSLVVVPYGVLNHLPVAALIGPDGRRLVERFSVLTLPSAGALVATRSRQPLQERNRHFVLAPFPERLPGTRSEAHAVGRTVPSATRFVGSAATEQLLRQSLSMPGRVHVASHAVLNELSPMFSRVELSRGSGRRRENDGRLEVHELLGMSVRSDLVFLSGCETGAGLTWSNSFRRGQDYATLSQGFLQAGARNVIATLWRIDDQGAAAFASRFYAELRTRRPVEALAAAQRHFLRHPKYSAPRYWAAYTIAGAGDRQTGLVSPPRGGTAVPAGPHAEP